jgi:putative aldouronate transport system permease protein
VGLQHFRYIFSETYFLTLVKNTVIFSLLDIVIAFPIPIILASVLFAAKSPAFIRTVKTAVYMPYFISMVVVCGMITEFVSETGFIGGIFQRLGLVNEGLSLLLNPKFFRPIIVISNTWQTMGFNSVLFVAAMAGIDPCLYESAAIDGAGKWRQYWGITLPSILPTIMMLLILKIGSILNVGFEKIYLLYNPMTYSVGDVLSTYTYRLGVEGTQQGLTTALGLLNSILGFALVVSANALSRRFTQKSLY